MLGIFYFSLATVIVRGPSLELVPTHSTIDPSSTETSVTVVRVAVTLPSLRSVSSPWNTNDGLLDVSAVVLDVFNVRDATKNPKLAPGGVVRSHVIIAPLIVQVKSTVSSGHATLVLDIRIPVGTHIASYSRLSFVLVYLADH